MTRQNISSGAPLKPVFGYSRAIRIGNTVRVSGPVSFAPDGKLAGPGDACAQCVRIFEIIEKALAKRGRVAETGYSYAGEVTEADLGPFAGRRRPGR